MTIEAKNVILDGLLELGCKILNGPGLGLQYMGDCNVQSNLAETLVYDSYLQNQVFYNLDGSEASRGEAILGTIQTGLAIAPFLKVGATTTELCIVSNPESVSFFEGTFYSPKVLWQMRKKAGEFHSFPELVRNYEKDGIIGPIVGGDGVTRIRLRIPGTYKKFDGYFDFIKEADGEINHRFFQIIKPK